jgi:hypothetical protein
MADSFVSSDAFPGCAPDPYPLGTWTGARDRSGRRVLSGDRMEITHSYMTRGKEGQRETITAIVEWDGNGGRWILRVNRALMFELYVYASEGKIVE